MIISSYFYDSYDIFHLAYSITGFVLNFEFGLSSGSNLNLNLGLDLKIQALCGLCLGLTHTHLGRA